MFDIRIYMVNMAKNYRKLFSLTTKCKYMTLNVGMELSI